MTTSLTQLDVDYVNEAQKRVCADTLLLEKKATITIPANSRTVTLPDDVINLLAVYSSTTRLDALNVDEMVCETSAVHEVNIARTPAWSVIGGVFYVTPIPTTPYVVTIIYQARSADYESDAPLELTGEAENLVERLVAAYKLLDDGQPERSASELASYQADARAYLGLARSRGGTPRRMLVAGYDRLA